MARSRYLYQLANIHIASDVPLPELSAARRGDAPLWVLRFADAPYPGPDARWLHEWLEPDGARWLQIGLAGDTYILRFASWVAFAVAVQARQIWCYRALDAPDATVRHLLLNQVLPLVLGGPSRIVLHAAAIQHQDRAIGFVGKSGAGKSTLGAAFAACGHAILTDDAMVIERRSAGLYVLPTYAGVRLWEDAARATLSDIPGRSLRVCHYSTKVRVSPAPFNLAPAKLDRLCLLSLERSKTSSVLARVLSPREASVALLECLFQLDITDRNALRDAFEMVGEVVQQVPVVGVEYPWNLDVLSDVPAALIPAIMST